MPTLLRDLQYSLRTLRKSPLFTSVAVLSLALGIGANVAIFTLVNQLILQLLPVSHPEQLVLLSARGQHYGSNTGSHSLTYPMYQDFRDKNQVFSGLVCRTGNIYSIGFQGRTELVEGEDVSGNYFSVLGVGAAVGACVHRRRRCDRRWPSACRAELHLPENAFRRRSRGGRQDDCGERLSPDRHRREPGRVRWRASGLFAAGSRAHGDAQSLAEDPVSGTEESQAAIRRGFWLVEARHDTGKGEGRNATSL